MSLNESRRGTTGMFDHSTRRWVTAGVTLLLGLLPTAWLSAQAPPIVGTVAITRSIRVIEADTLEVTINGKRVAAGLAGVKAPAGNTACGRQAIAALYALIAQGVELSDDGSAPVFDARNRRMFRIAILPARASLAVSLVSAGMGRPDPKTRGDEYQDISAADADARGHGRGCAP
jgi:endonuclease YncB( thermonuclease family)